jgi:hypothetical protein
VRDSGPAFHDGYEAPAADVVHLFFYDFYVYQYATGISAAHALAQNDFAVTRVVWPEDDLRREAASDTLRTIDDDRPARAADVWFVSVSFENALRHW